MLLPGYIDIMRRHIQEFFPKVFKDNPEWFIYFFLILLPCTVSRGPGAPALIHEISFKRSILLPKIGL